MHGVATPDANSREAIAEIGDERRISLDEKEAFGADSVLEKGTGDGSGSCTYFKNA